MKFKRAYLVQPGRFEIREVEESPKGDEVLVKIAACGLCNWELNFWKGYLNFTGYPHPLGHEWAGTVVELGPGVKTLNVGDNVAALVNGFGGFGEYKTAGEKNLQKLAPGINPRYALGEPLKCVVTVLRAVTPEAGDYGVMVGCGPMGLWCLQALAGNLLSGLIAVDVVDDKLQFAAKFGATQVINAVKEDVQERIKQITAGKMADFVIQPLFGHAFVHEISYLWLFRVQAVSTIE